MSEKQMIERYLEMDYPVLVTRDLETKNFVLEVPDWPGCLAHGATIDEAFRKLEDAKYTWVEDCLERGLEVPPPRPREEHSGKFVLRIARSLHRRLASLAEAEGTSLNTYVATVLAEHVGATTGLNLLKSVRDEVRNCLNQLGQYAENVTNPIATAAGYTWGFRELKGTLDFLPEIEGKRPRMPSRGLLITDFTTGEIETDTPCSDLTRHR